MQRLRESRSRDDGIALVWVVVGLATLLGVAAYVIDVGALFEERRQLQNGADAAALAIAYECVESMDGCTQTTADAIAAEYVPANARDGDATVTNVTLGAASVTVDVETLNDGEGFVAPFFSQFLGNSGVTVVAQATAEWSVGVLPVTVSDCEMASFFGEDWEARIDGGLTLGPQIFVLQSGGRAPCQAPSGQDFPGGFGFLDTVNSECQAQVFAYLADADVGASLPRDCGSYFPRTGSYQGPRPVFVAVYDAEALDAAGGVGSNARYPVYRYLAVDVGGYRFPGNSSSPPNDIRSQCGSTPGGGGGNCIELSFSDSPMRTGNPKLVRLTG